MSRPTQVRRGSKTRPPKTVYVVPNQDGRWEMKRDRAVKAFQQRAEAINEARTLARRLNGEIVIHSADGRIREVHSYEPVPYPREVVSAKNKWAVKQRGSRKPTFVASTKAEAIDFARALAGSDVYVHGSHGQVFISCKSSDLNDARIRRAIRKLTKH